jgi:hypothetical protein
MSKDFKFYFIATALLFLLVVWGLLLGGPAPLVLEAPEGGLSLDRLRPGDLVALEGEWRYRPSSLHEDILDGTGAPAAVTLPHLWTGEEAEGFATYGMTLKGLDPAMTYGIFIKDEAMAYRLTVGGEVLIESGREPSLPPSPMPSPSPVVFWSFSSVICPM